MCTFKLSVAVSGKNMNGAWWCIRRRPWDELTCSYFESDGMSLLKPTYMVFLLEWPLWEPVRWTASAHILANGAPCPLFSVLLSTTFFLPHTGCQAALTMNQSLGGGLFDCRWGKEVTGMHGFHSLSIGPCALNNSLTYFFSWDWEKPVWRQILRVTSHRLIDNQISMYCLYVVKFYRGWIFFFQS